MDGKTPAFDRDDRVAPLPVMPHTKYAKKPWSCFDCKGLWDGDCSICPKCGKDVDMKETADEPAKRYDAGKTAFADFATFFDDNFAEEIGKAFRYGAKKYGKHNWQKGMSWSRCFNSARRHLWQWWRGHTIDDESGCHHLALLVCSIMFLFVYERDSIGKDDR